MFVFIEAGYQLFRNRWRTVIMLISSAMLCGCVAFYLGSIESNERALEGLSGTIPVNVYVIDPSGARNDIMNIETGMVDPLAASPYLRDLHLRSVAAGAIGDEARREDPFVGGDTTITAVNCLEALESPDGELELADGRTQDLLEGNEALCLLDGEFARKHGVSVGDTITLPVHLLRWDSRFGWVYTGIGQQTFEVAGTWSSQISPRDMVVPVGWLRSAAEEVLGGMNDKETGARFVYTGCSAVLRDPMELDAFKASALEMDFVEPVLSYQNSYNGSSLAVEDERFITAAERLERNIAAFRQLMPPFFLLVTGLVVLVIFLVLRGARKDMAVAVSLGRPKPAIAAAQLIAVFSAQLAGCLAALPVMLLAGLGLGTLSICVAFLLCALLGDLLGLAAILRFDALKLLLQGE